MREQIKALGKAVIETETQAIIALGDRINDDFVNACEYMLACKGRIVVIGMGKSGHIAGKIAATLASTGSPAFFVHPGEASHGDLGMITPVDVVLALSNSGETDELITILPIIKRLGVPLISLTGNPDSSLATSANVNIDVSVAKEACPLGLAPTASTTAALVMGDALAVALLEKRGFNSDDFARSHPAGRLGRRLLLRVEDIMHKGAAIPTVRRDAKMTTALLEMTQKSLGMTAVVDEKNQLCGIFTDGDLRRSLDKKIDLHDSHINDLMSKNPRTINADSLAVDALDLMKQHNISVILITHNQQLIGALSMHDLLRAKVV